MILFFFYKVQNKVPIQSGPSSFNQHDMSKVIAPGRQKEKQKQQWVVKVGSI